VVSNNFFSFLGLNVPTHVTFPGHRRVDVRVALAGNAIHTLIRSAFLAKLSYLYIQMPSHIPGDRREGGLFYILLEMDHSSQGFPSALPTIVKPAQRSEAMRKGSQNPVSPYFGVGGNNVNPWA
jgi:hypothetical protein